MRGILGGGEGISTGVGTSHQTDLTLQAKKRGGLSPNPAPTSGFCSRYF